MTAEDKHVKIKDMNSFQLECFLAVADHLNFARAAKQLSVTQPTITHQIQSLESELQVKLFNRSTRSVALTFDGEIFLPEAKTFVLHFRSLKSKFGESRGRSMILLRIGCASHSLMRLLPNALFLLTSQEPLVHPVIQSVLTPQIVKHIEDGIIDIALGLSEPIPKESDVVYTELLKTSLICLCDSTHPLSEKKSVTLAQIKEHALVFYRPAACASEIATLQIELGRGKRPEDLYMSDDILSAMTLAGAGLGVCILPKIFLHGDMPTLKVIPVADLSPLSFGIYHKKNSNDLLRTFIRLLKEQCLSFAASEKKNTAQNAP